MYSGPVAPGAGGEGAILGAAPHCWGGRRRREGLEVGEHRVWVLQDEGRRGCRRAAVDLVEAKAVMLCQVELLQRLSTAAPHSLPGCLHRSLVGSERRGMRLAAWQSRLPGCPQLRHPEPLLHSRGDGWGARLVQPRACAPMPPHSSAAEGAHMRLLCHAVCAANASARALSVPAPCTSAPTATQPCISVAAYHGSPRCGGSAAGAGPTVRILGIDPQDPVRSISTDGDGTLHIGNLAQCRRHAVWQTKRNTDGGAF